MYFEVWLHCQPDFVIISWALPMVLISLRLQSSELTD